MTEETEKKTRKKSYCVKMICGRISPLVQQVKDPVLSLQWLESLLWRGFNPWLGNLNAVGVAKKKKICDFFHNLSSKTELNRI